MWTIRPHHGLCTLFFVGKGYSPDFVRRMGEIIETAAHGGELRLTTQADEICACCPNRVDDQCSGMNAPAFDEKVLALTGLNEGDIVTLPHLQTAVTEHILHPGRLEEVCGDCQWADICRNQWNAGKG